MAAGVKGTRVRHLALGASLRAFPSFSSPFGGWDLFRLPPGCQKALVRGKAVGFLSLFSLAMGWWPPQQGPAILPHQCLPFVHSECERPREKASQLHVQSHIHLSTNSFILFLFNYCQKISESLGDLLKYSEAWAHCPAPGPTALESLGVRSWLF